MYFWRYAGMCVCMNGCTYVWMYVRMHVFVRMYVALYIRMYVRMDGNVHVCMSVAMYK